MEETRSALGVVDVQNDLVDSQGAAGHWADLGPCRSCVSTMIPTARRFRSLGQLVIYVRSEYGPATDSPAVRDRPPPSANASGNAPLICGAGTWRSELYRVRPEPADRIITKHRYSGFVGTDVGFTLRAQGVSTVFFGGVTTDVCVDSTPRDEFMRDFENVTLEDRCAAYDRQAHEHTLRTFRAAA